MIKNYKNLNLVDELKAITVDSAEISDSKEKFQKLIKEGISSLALPESPSPLSFSKSLLEKPIIPQTFLNFNIASINVKNELQKGLKNDNVFRVKTGEEWLEALADLGNEAAEKTKDALTSIVKKAFSFLSNENENNSSSKVNYNVHINLSPKLKTSSSLSKSFVIDSSTKDENNKSLTEEESLDPIVSPVQVLTNMLTIPDFLGNTFTAYLCWNDTSSVDLKLTNEFSFRLEGISIPLPKKKEYDIKFLNTSIKKIESMTDLTRTLSISLRADEDLYINKFLEENSGVKNWKKYSLDSLSPLVTTGYQKGAANEFTLIVVHNILAGSKIHNLEPNIPLKTKADLEKLTGNFIIYTFNRVRFLGRTSNISLKATNADPLIISYNLAFRNVTSKVWNKE